MPLTTLIVAIIILCLALWLVRFIPDPTVAKWVRVAVIVIAVFWVIRHMNAILHCCST